MKLTSADGLLRIEVSGGKVIGTTPVNDGQWHHVAAVLVDDSTPNVSEVKLYVDGQLESYSVQGNQSIDTGSVSPVRVGICIEQSGGRYFDGLVDDVRIYDRAMADGEVLELFNE